MYRILLIAGSGDLNTRPEVLMVQRAGRTQRARTLADVYAITVDQEFDIVHIAGHGDEHGIVLGDEILDADTLIRIARKVRARLVYLNACSSARLGQRLVDSGVAHVIMTTTSEFDDHYDAWAIAGYFFSEVLAGASFHRAYQTAKPSDGALAWMGRCDEGEQPIHWGQGHYILFGVLIVLQLVALLLWFL
jgi:hypothetical protein